MNPDYSQQTWIIRVYVILYLSKRLVYVILKLFIQIYTTDMKISIFWKKSRFLRILIPKTVMSTWKLWIPIPVSTIRISADTHRITLTQRPETSWYFCSHRSIIINRQFINTQEDCRYEIQITFPKEKMKLTLSK